MNSEIYLLSKLIMKVFYKFFLTFVLISKSLFLNASLVDNQNLYENNGINSCFIYSPYLGLVNDIEKLDVSSDDFRLSDNNKIYLAGNVIIDFPEGMIYSNLANLDQDNKNILFKGESKIIFEDYFISASEGSFNRDDNEISLNEGQIFFNERQLIFAFDALKGNLKEGINLENASVTSCLDEQKGWAIKADEININTDTNRGLAENVAIKLRDQTIFYSPVLPFPTSSERMSGFLEPSLSYSSDGIDLNLPYFLVIDEKSDLTLSARNISERGSGVEINYRKKHLSNIRNIDLIYFNDDKEFKNENNLTEKYSRWAYKINDAFDFNKVQINVNWSKASDDMVLRDIPGEITNIGNRYDYVLPQFINLKYADKTFKANIYHGGFQTLNPLLTDGYKVSPALDLVFFKKFRKFNIENKFNYSSFKANRIHDFYSNQSAMMMSDSMNIEQNYKSTILDPIEGNRIFTSINANTRKTLGKTSININSGMYALSYDLNMQAHDESVLVPKADISMQYTSSKKTQNGMRAITPKIMLGYTGYEDQSQNPIFDTYELTPNNIIFSNNRFTGMDRIGDQKFVSVGLNIMSMNSNKDNLMFFVGKKIYLENPINKIGGISPNSKDNSPIAIMTNYKTHNNFNFRLYTGLREKDDRVLLGGADISKEYKNLSINYSKRYRRMAGSFGETLDYSELGSQINISSRIKIYAKIKQDDEKNRIIENIIGIEYEDCCYKFRLVGRDRDYSNFNVYNNQNNYQYLQDAWKDLIEIQSKGSISFEFELKGFNSSFDKVGRLFNNSLSKY